MSSSVSQSKSNKMPKKTEPAPAAAPVVATPAAKAAPAAKGKKAPAQTEVVVPVVATPAVAAAPAEVRSADAILTAALEAVRAHAKAAAEASRALAHDLQEAAKAIKREARDSKRRRKVNPATLSPEARAAWEARRANNAFLKVRPLSDELCGFMGLASKSQKSQTDVTKFISGYVKSHSCFDPSFKRRILPDAKLAKLLRVTDKDEVTYLNLQTYLKVHFLKPATA
uniref:DM2 domain-containing protein n=1 Tax=viral metagenome TaxID=1070528 RepID=A0A6C0B2E2_9ZZZZ